MSLPGGDARFVVAASAVLLVAVLGLAGYALMGAYDRVQAPLAAVEARYARLVGLKEARARIEVGVAEAGETLARHAYPAAAGTDRIGTDLQQRVRRVAEWAGMGVTGSQILPVRDAAGLSQIPVAVTVEGSLEGLSNLLTGLQAENPSVQVDSVVIQTLARRRARGAPPERRLTVQMDLSVLQLQP